MALDEKRREALHELNENAAHCRQQGDLTGAITYLESALSLIQNSDPSLAGKIHSAIGLMQIEHKKLQLAASSFTAAAALFLQEGNHSARAVQIGNIGSIYRDLEHYDDALHHYREALAIFTQERFIPGIADQHANIAFALTQQGQSLEAISHFRKASETYAQCGQPERAALCNENISLLTPHE